MRKIHLVTFGCQMNKLDSELAAEALAEAGHQLVASEDEADTVIFNTCSVRDHAEQRVLSRLSQLRGRRESEPGFRLGVIGCFAERTGESLLRRLPFLDFVAGTRQFLRLPEILARLESGQTHLLGDAPESVTHLQSAHSRQRHQGTQAYLSVLRGCSNHCAYCVVPAVRGGEVSRPGPEIVEEARRLVAGGAREIILLGQNIDAYDRQGEGLAGLLQALDQAIPEEDGLRRIRFVTSHPRDIDRRLLEAIALLPRVARHFHMPAQSGSDAVLTRMRRGYSRSQYEEKVAMIREILPDAQIASDFIVGFPGETEADFQASLELLTEARFQNSFIFKYSPRPGTLAERQYPDDVPLPEKKSRHARLLARQEEVSRERAQSLLGSRQRVLVEGLSKRDQRRLTGRTAGNLICVFPPPATGEVRPGDLVDVEIFDATPLALYAKLCLDASLTPSGEGTGNV
ncbi:MAG: tRNA (N6-isopentenyl adenosine(37)-C2)-methylthiotransferase MiaB [Planctomycetota bacterium]|jgi:tRNA-2-methylthio-N6-dimethylallyladenosine synthase|nr:tRNA (N6-isopentenyl adenosine(37)-C2)-methylthiotransferase MiaB [Planctomycetota bacterium]